ncbi:MAG: hypothetical protein IPJ03_00240 [Ignavibacteriales bacterium]|nr:hypothetical protein [Ignavibacteriales bacterium]
MRSQTSKVKRQRLEGRNGKWMWEVALRPRSAGQAFSSFDPALRGKHSHPSTGST